MKNIYLYVPKVEDYWYEEKIKSDPLTMNYNSGYDVSYYGYHYDTGCIDFPKDKWQETFDKRINEKMFLAYIKDEDIDEFVGYVNYHYDEYLEKYECGIVIESNYRGKGYGKEALLLLCNRAKADGIKELYDSFEIDRDNTLDLFCSVGFKIIDKKVGVKFGKKVDIVLVKKVL